MQTERHEVADCRLEGQTISKCSTWFNAMAGRISLLWSRQTLPAGSGGRQCHAEIASAIKNHHDIMTHWEELLPGRVLRVPYEQLVEDQEGWSRRLLQHCGLPWDERVLDFHKTERDVQTASLGQASDLQSQWLCLPSR